MFQNKHTTIQENSKGKTAHNRSSSVIPSFLILGGGAVVSEYYIPALSILGYASKSVIVELSHSRVENLKRNFQNLSVEQEDYINFLNERSENDEFDAVIVALPNSLHEEAIRCCLSQGMHALCEKPLSLSSDSCRKLAEEANAAKRILAVGMVQRLLPSISSLRKALDQELIGEIFSVNIEDGRKYVWSPSSDARTRPENGGVLADMGIHYLDLVEYLLGKLVPISYHDDMAGGVEANCEYKLRTESGVSVRLCLSRTHELQNSIIFHGRLGELILRKETFDHCFWTNQDRTIESKIWPTRPFHWGEWPAVFESCFLEQICKFAAAMQGQRVSYVTGHDAATTVGLIEWAYKNRKLKVQSSSKVTGKIKATPSSHELGNATVYITGGTGFIGTRLIERLGELGVNKIKIPVRNFQNCSQIARFPVEVERVNLLDYEQVCEAINGAHYVFHLAYGRDGTDSVRSRMTIEGSKNTVEASIETGAQCVVVLSTTKVFGRPDSDTKVDESWPYAPAGGEYGKSKTKMEQWCLNRASTSRKTRIVVLNPTCVYGIYGKTFTTMPITMAMHGTFCWVDDGRGLANYTFIDNLVDAILLAANCEEAHGHRFIINDGTTTWRKFLYPLLGSYADNLQSYTKDQLKAFEPRSSIFEIVKAGLNASIKDNDFIELLKQNKLMRLTLNIAEGWMSELLEKIREIRRPSPLNPGEIGFSSNRRIPPVWLADLFGPTSTVFSSSKAQEVLGWSPKIGIQEGQILTQEWLRTIKLM